jgi:hypothetical protein
MTNEVASGNKERTALKGTSFDLEREMHALTKSIALHRMIIHFTQRTFELGYRNNNSAFERALCYCVEK